MLFNRTFINTSALPTLPVITLQPVAQSIAVGATLTLTATASEADCPSVDHNYVKVQSDKLASLLA